MGEVWGVVYIGGKPSCIEATQSENMKITNGV